MSNIKNFEKDVVIIEKRFFRRPPTKENRTAFSMEILRLVMQKYEPIKKDCLLFLIDRAIGHELMKQMKSNSVEFDEYCKYNDITFN